GFDRALRADWSRGDPGCRSLVRAAGDPHTPWRNTVCFGRAAERVSGMDLVRSTSHRSAEGRLGAAAGTVSRYRVHRRMAGTVAGAVGGVRDLPDGDIAGSSVGRTSDDRIQFPFAAVGLGSPRAFRRAACRPPRMELAFAGASRLAEAGCGVLLAG